MSPFLFERYQDFLQARFELMPQKGYGQQRRLALALGMHTSHLSQVMGGLKNFTEEQAAGVAEYLGLNMRESEFFLLLVQRERAGTTALKKILERRLQELRKESQEVKSRVPNSSVELDEGQRALFYSHWHYSAIRLLSSVPGMDIESLADRLGVSRSRVQRVLEFLLETGLCRRDEKGSLGMGTANTHIEASSPLVTRHHGNWRLRALEVMESQNPKNLHFTSPLVCSREDFERIRRMCLDHISQVAKVVGDSPSEELYCLQMDVFGVTKTL